MKKVLAAVLCAVLLAGCGKKIEGTYVCNAIRIGEETYESGTGRWYTAFGEEDYSTIEIGKEEITITLGEESFTGTYTVKDDKITVTISEDERPFKLYCDGKTVEFDLGTMTLVYKKAE
ncbi:MAG: hypothetical protein HUJ58_08630 [Erysipelotrichaceae bacterium]|nr:hypothetical protein [Erysipelotrichaceae bacterium]